VAAAAALIDERSRSGFAAAVMARPMPMRGGLPAFSICWPDVEEPKGKRMTQDRTTAVRCWVAAVLLMLAPGVRAQDWPTRPIKIVTPLAAGGAADVIGHAVGDAFTAATKLPVIIDNRPGGGGTLAAVTVARAEPDGTTLLLGTAAALNVAPVLAKNFPADLVAGLTPLTLAVELPMCLVVNKSLPVNNITELIAYVKANPGKLAFGSSGANTVHHIAGEFLKIRAGLDMVHVPYRGGSPAMTDLLSGQIPILFATLSTAIPFIDSGAVKVIGMVEDKRSRSRPNIPTIAEGLPGYAMPQSWVGLLGPAGMSPGLVARMNGELVAAISSPKTRKTLEDNGFEVMTSSPEEFANVIKESLARYRKITAEAGIEAQ
jgi:tripartite-type tricarboxylate transporter receptor subunit TctC